ncbi:protein of unknown function [Hyphomicrobium sp. MC1]|nr:protein of unknown function [Hyphomicrobium sp. MC1]
MPWRSRAFKTPMCAHPRAAPPPSANPILTLVLPSMIGTPDTHPLPAMVFADTSAATLSPAD